MAHSEEQSTPRLATLSRTHFVLVAANLAAIATASAMAIGWPNRLYELKCTHFDLPHYEASFGFTLGVMEVPTPGGGTHSVRGITALDPKGTLSRAGARVADVPSMYHGVSDFCAELSAAAAGETVQLHLYNLNDAKAGKEPGRAIALRTH
jgi:hypothetical protein